MITTFSTSFAIAHVLLTLLRSRKRLYTLFSGSPYYRMTGETVRSHSIGGRVAMGDKPSRWSGLREILRYVPRFRDRVFVIALDGALVEHDNFGTILVDIALLR